MSEGSDVEVEQKMSWYLTKVEDPSGFNKGQKGMVECEEESEEKQRGSQPQARKVSSEGEMRSVKRTRPVEKGKEKAMEEKENTAEREDLEAKELIERARGSKWRQTWRQVAHTPRPRRTRKERKQ